MSKTARTFTAIIHREEEWYVANCAEIGTVSQGKTLEEAIANLKEATELYLKDFEPPNIDLLVITHFTTEI